MYSGTIQILALALFGVCLYHSWRTEGARYAQQWFAAGYYLALVREILLVQLGAISYSDQMAQFGGAPSVTVLLVPALIYLAYVFARRLLGEQGDRLILLTVFLLTPALALPIDAAAVYFGWWTFPSESISFMNGIPYYVPLAWGVTGALLYAAMRFVRGIRLRGGGQFFALVLGAPLVAGIDVALIALLQVLVNAMALVPGNLLLNALLALLLLILPLALIAVPKTAT